MALTTVISSTTLNLLQVFLTSTSNFAPGTMQIPFATDFAVGDFNGDGIPDIAISTKYGNGFAPGPLLILLGTATGGLTDGSASLFGGTVQYALGSGAVATGDFNGDGRSDIVVGNSGLDQPPFAGAQSNLYLSTSSGLTNATANLPQVMTQSEVTTGDINHDGNLDIILTGPAGEEVLLGDGKGHFTRADQLIPANLNPLGYYSSALVDVNGDGWADLVLGVDSGNGTPSTSSLIYLNNGTGSFAASQPIALPNSPIPHPSVLAMTSGDINGDGLPDLVLSVTNGPWAGAAGYNITYIQILINEGGGQFQDETSLLLPQSTTINLGASGGANSVKLEDVDGDGAPDLVVSGAGAGGTLIYLNDGTGHFSTTPYTIPYATVPVANYDGTGKMAFVGVNGATVNVIADDIPSKAATLAPLATAYLAVMRHDSGSVDAAALAVLADAVFAGSMTQAAAIQAVVADAQSTSSVATLAYEFFTGSTPTAAGMDYLVSPTGPNPNNLNSAYYAQFSTTNRYINFASNLGKIGAGATAFQAAYGSLDLSDATAKAYTTIFGAAPSADKLNHLLNDMVPDGLGGMETRSQYFEFYGQDGLNGQGTKAAMVGWLLATAVSANLGDYALSNDAFLTAIAGGTASYGIDLIGQYDQASYHYTGP